MGKMNLQALFAEALKGHVCKNGKVLRVITREMTDAERAERDKRAAKRAAKRAKRAKR